MNNGKNSATWAAEEKKTLRDYINGDAFEEELTKEFVSAKTMKQELSELIRKAGNCYDKLRKRDYYGIEEGTGLFVEGMVALHEARGLLYILKDPSNAAQTISRLRSSLNHLFFPSGRNLITYRVGELEWGKHIRIR